MQGGTSELWPALTQSRCRLVGKSVPRCGPASSSTMAMLQRPNLPPRTRVYTSLTSNPNSLRVGQSDIDGEGEEERRGGEGSKDMCVLIRGREGEKRKREGEEERRGRESRDRCQLATGVRVSITKAMERGVGTGWG
uniref:Uncharacterized protein n=1 Tax=Knipowitschia caucasica TaxID=637954 RepID=A0AAV2ITK1_KNICA